MGESKKALQLPLKKEWMKEEILAKIACIEKNEKAFQTHCNNAIECSKGIFRYSLIASFRTLRKEMNSAI